MSSIIIADQTEIAASFNGSSLFVNGVHIVDADDNNDFPLEDIAESLSIALDSTVRRVKVTEKKLAIAVAKRLGQYDELEREIDSGEVVYDDWHQGYSNDDVLSTLA
jgi:hypothetical protein